MAANKREAATLSGSWQLLKPSIDLIRENIDTVIIIIVIPSLIIELGLILSGNGSTTAAAHAGVGIPIAIVGVALAIVNLPVTCYLQLKAASRKKPGLSECYRRGYRFFWRVIAVNLLVDAIVVVGLLLLIVPGLLLLRRYYLSQYYIVDRDMGVIEAMKCSANETKSLSIYIWGMLGVILVLSVCGLAASSLFGFIPGLGIIISVIISVLYTFGPALRYFEVKKFNS
jgi:hypothetical protein